MCIRDRLWRLKRSAADLLDVELDDQPPPMQKVTERTPAHQRALDVASRWVTADDAFATEYAEALAAVARRQISRKDSGGDDGAEPPQKKRRTRRK